jgi:hypothetical protein
MDPFPEKPNGMHWCTYERFCRQVEVRHAQFSAGLESLMGQSGQENITKRNGHGNAAPSQE